MNAFVSPASLYLSSPFTSSWAVFDNMNASSWPRDELSVQYDDRGRLQPFVETAEQRRARLAFLRKGKLSKRISIWLDEAALSSGDNEGYMDQRHTLSSSSRRSSSSSLRTINEEDESEPEVIYATAPSPRWAVPPTILPQRSPYNHPRTGSVSSLDSTHTSSSLSSISEED